MTDNLRPTHDDTVTSSGPGMTRDALAGNAEFLSALSHELRMPLAAIRGFSQLLITHWEELPEDKRLRNVEQIMRSTLRMERLVNDISLATSLVDEVETRLGRAELAVLIEAAVEEVSSAHHGRRFVVERPPNAYPAWADRERVLQVLVNLLDNAAKYSPPNTPIVVRQQAGTDTIRVEVADHGIGLTPDEQARLFARFSRLRSTRNASGLIAGTGLGLYICRRLVEAMGGKIGVQADDEGTGNTFWFTLPRAEAGSPTAVGSIFSSG